MSAAPADPLERETLEERFVEVICDDEELLAAEFEAIVSAGWLPLPPARAHGADLRRPQDDPHPLDRTVSRAGSHESVGVPARARQRSPPPRERATARRQA